MDDATQLLLAAGDGDEAAFAAFVRATQADVWRFCAHQVDVQAADDLVQDVYVRVAKSMHGFRGDASARTWLMTITRRVCADHLRRVVRRRRHEAPTRPEDLTDVAGSTATPHEPDWPVDLDRMLAGLSAERREALVLTQVLGMSYAEAAAAAGVPVGTVRSRVARARADLVAARATALGGDDERQGRDRRANG
jgi:RNA polymerase sigma-70 factor (ECF subfamily)